MTEADLFRRFAKLAMRRSSSKFTSADEKRALINLACRYAQAALIPRRGMTAGPEEKIALLMRRWEQVKAGDGAVVLIGGEPGNREIAPPDRLIDHRL